MVYVLRLILAAFSGFITYGSFEPHGFWWAGIAGIALLYASLIPWGRHKPTGWGGAGLGFAHGFVLYIFLLPWIGEFVGPLPGWPLRSRARCTRWAPGLSVRGLPVTAGDSWLSPSSTWRWSSRVPPSPLAGFRGCVLLGARSTARSRFLRRGEAPHW